MIRNMLVTCVLALGSSLAPATEPITDPAAARVTLADSEQRTMRSATGKDYRIFVATPSQKAPPGGWPVVYVLDGNAWFLSFAQQARLRGRNPGVIGSLPVLVVGVGYPGERLLDRGRRVYDFTPPAPEREPPPAPDGKPWPAPGGADELLDFIEHELKPAIEADYRVDRRRQALYGHSLGGLLVLHALFTRPHNYRSFAAVSPSLWWNRHYVLEEEKAFAQRAADERVDAELLLAVGGGELPHMVADARALAQTLQPSAQRGLRLQFAEIADEDHIGVPLPAFTRLLKFAFAPSESDKDYYQRKPPEGAVAPVFADATAYLALSAQQRTQIRVQVRELPKPERDAYNLRMRVLIHEHMSPQQRRELAREKVREDRRHGTVTVLD